MCVCVCGSASGGVLAPASLSFRRSHFVHIGAKTHISTVRMESGRSYNMMVMAERKRREEKQTSLQAVLWRKQG